MSDGWTDRKRRSICNFLVNSPKGTVFMYSLDTSDISKTTDKVFEMLDEMVGTVGEENVIQVITNNAANYKAAGKRLMEKRKHLYWTPCAAHCIDLMLEDFEKHIPLHKTTISSGRKITTFIYARTMLISILRNFTKGRDLIRPATTRFATSYLTLACLNENKGALMNMFSSKEWTESKFSSIRDGKQVENCVLDNGFWKNIVTCLQAAAPLIKVLRLVDSDEKPAMGFIYEAMNCGRERIKQNFNNVKKSYEPIWNIIDERWEAQLHRPLHAAAYYVNPHFRYSPSFQNDYFVKDGLFKCLDRFILDEDTRSTIDRQMVDFSEARGMFGLNSAKANREKMSPADWWLAYGDGCPELQKFAIRILSLTCSSSGCERNWNAFEMVHTKRRNRLHQKKMNALVYVKSNLKLRNKEKRSHVSSFDDMHSDDEWITEGIDVEDEEDEVEQPLYVNDKKSIILFIHKIYTSSARQEPVENPRQSRARDFPHLPPNQTLPLPRRRRLLLLHSLEALLHYLRQDLLQRDDGTERSDATR
ncbi:zf-BED domain-containing protein/DUF659 domain-containing protein/Dimer_Tnp_hAT domain-containing protein [Senna tora]|uniref:Zf-BED domain-containing protein/DUF659 domain-containing protein/Dimer_Tnp_hAT domain-containing protein n=1 Tax=Senna tora TaxID=362788 RepID=A0A835C4M7_9FABA|nr:zf-BED domain-containing protein/DUF659 domain-containing protein/Dimer_Tnp_hAT domain-containing protein [Senna tora]